VVERFAGLQFFQRLPKDSHKSPPVRPPARPPVPHPPAPPAAPDWGTRASQTCRFVKPLCSAVNCALPPPWRKDKALPESGRIVELK